MTKIAAVSGSYERAGRLGGAAERLREEMRSPTPPSELADYQQAIAHAREGAGAVAFDVATIDGRRIASDAAIAHALGTREAPTAARRTSGASG